MLRRRLFVLRVSQILRPSRLFTSSRLVHWTLYQQCQRRSTFSWGSTGASAPLFPFRACHVPSLGEPVYREGSSPKPLGSAQVNDTSTAMAVPCSTYLTIGDIRIPVPNCARHPERVVWESPGADHNLPFLQTRNDPNFVSVPEASLPSLLGNRDENMFFTTQEPLTRSYLRWIAQKEQLGQDMCLVGDPGPAMRWLVMLYSYLTRREIRVVYLNSDTTESDLKQRREIRNGSLVYDDQSAVSAAIDGQLLVLEGLERVERNVLPVINNLLENREMHLDNGSVLIHPERYDALLHDLYQSKLHQRRGTTATAPGESNAETVELSTLMQEARHELTQMGLIRVSEKFRVIGITIPVPPYEGNPLDPPLRSRFQCLYVRTPLPVISAATSIMGSLAGSSSGRKRQKVLESLQEVQSNRCLQVAKLHAAIDAVNESTSDFVLSKPTKAKMKSPTGKPGSRSSLHYGRGNQGYEESLRREAATEEEEGGRSEDSSTASAPATSSPLQSIGKYELGVIMQQLSLYPDIPVGEAVSRGFPWHLYARQLTRQGSGGAATGYANVEDHSRRLHQYSELLYQCQIFPPLLLPVDLVEPVPLPGSHRSGSPSRRSSREELSSKTQRVSDALRAVVRRGSGATGSEVEPTKVASARRYIQSAQLVSQVCAAKVEGVPLEIQETCNYILRLERDHGVPEGPLFSGVPVVVAEAVVATSTHDSDQAGSAGTYRLKVFLGQKALCEKDGEDDCATWKRDIASYLCTTAAPTTVFTAEHYHVLQEMLQIHVSRQHLCLLGPTGCGKTAIVRAFSRVLGYDVETMHLYADMTNKDLFQQRMTDPKTGNTTWQDSPLLHGAKYGKLVVLDGMDKIPGGMLASLQQLLVDGNAVLADGTILKPPTEYEVLKEKWGRRDPVTGTLVCAATDEEMQERKIFPIHPGFRVVATARPPVPSSSSSGGAVAHAGKEFFITQDLTTLFRTVVMPEAREAALHPVLRQIAQAEVYTMETEDLISPGETSAAMLRRSSIVVERLLNLRSELEKLHSVDGKMPQLSLRQLRQLVRAAVRYPSRVEQSVQNTLLLPLMTGVAATKVQRALESCGLGTEPEHSSQSATRDAVDNEFLSVTASAPLRHTVDANSNARDHSSPSLPRLWSVGGQPVLHVTRHYTKKELALVPFVTGFQANRVHESIMAWLAKQYAMGSNILLIGNQGVGKNKVVDAFLSRLGIPRHYIQLHRDTTVGSLTINPTVEAGRVIWEDSPLVKAVQHGHCLVVDEIDKAPVEVVQVLKGLIEDREMRLGDGRHIYDPSLESDSTVSGNVVGGSPATTGSERIAIHPDFRIIVLANPPGFPFHGNDFFRECGDLFAAYVMRNPDAASQLRVLRSYAPSLPQPLLERLVQVFMELQSAFEQGHLTYPFSLRELIAVVKHMSRYPQDGIYQALNNVFNFDARDENTLRYVRQILSQRLQPLIEHGGMRRLLSFKAGIPVPLLPSENHMKVPLTRSASSSSSAATPLSASVVWSPSEFLQRTTQCWDSARKNERDETPATSALLTWRSVYPESAFFHRAMESSEEGETRATFTEWTGHYHLPFLQTDTDTVLGITPLSTYDTISTIPSLVSMLIERREVNHQVPQRRILLFTYRLPPSSLDLPQLIGTAEEEWTARWPVGHVFGVDMSSFFVEEAQSEETVRGQSKESWTLSSFNMNDFGLPWSCRESTGEPAALKLWPSSLKRQPATLSLLKVVEPAPLAVLMVVSPISGRVVLVDGLAGATCELAAISTGSHMNQVSTESANTAGSMVASDPCHVAFPIPLNEVHATSGEAGGALLPRTASPPTVLHHILDVGAAFGILSFLEPAVSRSVAYCMVKGCIVSVSLPHPVLSLSFVTDQLAMVEMEAPGPPGTSTGSEVVRGVLKLVVVKTNGGPSTGSAEVLNCSSSRVTVTASLLELPSNFAARLVDVAQLKKNEVATAASTATAFAKHLDPVELNGSVWVPTDMVKTSTAVVPNCGAASQGTPGAISTDSVVAYMQVEGVMDEHMQVKPYYTSASSAKLLGARMGGHDAVVKVDTKHHQLLYLNNGIVEGDRSFDSPQITAVDTASRTMRSFTSLGDSAASQLSFGTSSQNGTAYAWDPTHQQLSVADIEAERVHQRYAEWSALLTGSSDAVGSSASTEDEDPNGKDYKMEYSTPRKKPSGTLKHGEVDEKEHHGGNTWAGGTGGTDTAGLGGIIGPYRLDKGNPVHQVSPEEKRKVPKHLIEEARRMGKEALKERLQAIGMSEAEYSQYKQLQERVQPSVAQLRTLLMGLRAAEGERHWVTGQTDGVWDDKKLIEGIVGEKNVYKRRMDSKDSNPFQQKYKKRLVFVLDVSASMYRFEGMDRRLTKLLETTIMIMEAFAGFESKIDYAMIGHNGDSDHIPLVNFGTPPANQKERMVICQKMIAYAQYCWSGDNTVESMRRSIELVTAEKGDSYFVFVISDANLRQYGITPRELTDIILSKSEVKMFCIFIATLGAQASHLQQQLPAGHGYECMKTDALPHVLRQIFTSVNLF